MGDGVERVWGGGTFCEVDDLHLRTHLTSTMSLWRLLDQRWLLVFFLTLVTGPTRFLSLKLSDTRVYEPQIRAPCTLYLALKLRAYGLGIKIKKEEDEEAAVCL